MATPITSIPVYRTVNGFQIEGRVCRVEPVPLGSAAVDADDTAYRALASGQSREIEGYFDLQYAYQPVGVRRFKPAEMRNPWENYDASAYRVISTQGYSEEGGSLTTRAEWPGEDPFSPATWQGREGEDCLRLHIMVPRGTPPVGGWPCMVHFHGGGGNYLSAASHAERAMRLCQMGIAVISVEFRLGTMSHVYHPDMEAELDYDGTNLGLTDMVASLGWINAWGAAFDINIAKITLMGSSNGGNSIAVLMLDAYARSLFQQAWISSPSGGYNQRWAKQPFRYTRGYAAFYAENHGVVQALGSVLTDSQNDKRPFSAAITDKGFWPAYRENLDTNSVLAVGNGHYSRSGLTYYGTNGLPMMMDSVYVNHRNNRAAAVALAFPGTHKVIICVAQQESSVIGFGTDPYPWDANLNDLAACNVATWTASPVVGFEYNGVAGAAWTTVEINRQIFNIGYQHAALWMARAITNAGADAYLLWNNCPNELKATRFSGHAGDIPFLTGNPNWSVAETLVTAQDVYLSEWFMRMLVNFCYSGNPNTPSGYAGAMTLFAAPSTQTLTKFTAASQNWNVLGSANRSAAVTDTTVTNTPNFASHIWNWLDTQNGWTRP